MNSQGLVHPLRRPALPGAKAGLKGATVGIVLIVLLVVLNSYLLIAPHQPIGPLGLACASGTIWVCAFPLWRFYAAGQRTVPYLVFASIAYAAYYSSPVFRNRSIFDVSELPDVGLDAAARASQLALLGAVTFMFGAYMFPRWTRRLGQIHREIDFRRAMPHIVTIAVITFLIRLLTFKGAGVATQIFIVFHRWNDMALCALFLAWLRGQAAPWHKAVYLTLLGGVIVFGLSTGILGQVVYPVAAQLFLFCWEKRRIPWGFLLLAVVVVAPFQLTKVHFRESHERPSDSQISPGNTVDLFSEFFWTTYEEVALGRITLDDIQEGGETRGNMLSTFAVVVEETPQRIPYWDGYTYSDLLWHLIPRVLVPNKPAPAMGQEFPRRYGIIAYDNIQTSFNLPLLVEAYINYGPGGVGVIMLIIGLICGTIERALSVSTGGAIVGAVLLSGFMSIESNFSLLFGGTPYILPGLYLFVRLLPATPPPAETPPPLPSAEPAPDAA